MGFHRPGPTSGRAWGPSGPGDPAEPCGQLPVRRRLERSIPVRPGHHAVPAGAFLRNGRATPRPPRPQRSSKRTGSTRWWRHRRTEPSCWREPGTGTRCRCGTSCSSASRWEPSGSASCARPHRTSPCGRWPIRRPRPVPSGYQCRHQTGAVHHVHEDAIVLEVVDEAGRPVPPGTPGELVVTPLTTSGMALLRYRLGDRGQLLTGACALRQRRPIGLAAGPHAELDDGRHDHVLQ